MNHGLDYRGADDEEETYLENRVDCDEEAMHLGNRVAGGGAVIYLDSEN